MSASRWDKVAVVGKLPAEELGRAVTRRLQDYHESVRRSKVAVFGKLPADEDTRV